MNISDFLIIQCQCGKTLTFCDEDVLNVKAKLTTLTTSKSQSFREPLCHLLYVSGATAVLIECDTGYCFNIEIFFLFNAFEPRSTAYLHHWYQDKMYLV